jgi:hypothetical protein
MKLKRTYSSYNLPFKNQTLDSPNPKEDFFYFER